MPQDYIYANGRVSVLEMKLLNAEKYSRMLDASRAEDALKVLYESNYANGLVLERTADFEKLLDAEMRSVCDFFKSETTDNKAAQCFILQFDYQNVKLLMKMKYLRLEKNDYLSENGQLPLDRLKTAVMTDNYREIMPVEMAEACETIDSEFADGNRKSTVIDITLDQAMYRQLVKTANECKTPAVKSYVRAEVDGKNILTLFRVRKSHLTSDQLKALYLQGGSFSCEHVHQWFETEGEDLLKTFGESEYLPLVKLCVEAERTGASLLKGELWAEAHKYEMLEPYRNAFSGIEPIICYYLAKRKEIDNVRLIMVGIRNDVDRTVIRERLRG